MSRAARLRLAAAAVLAGAWGCFAPSATLRPDRGLQRSQADFHDCPTVVLDRPDEGPTQYRLEWRPRLLLSGARGVEVRIRLAGLGSAPGQYRFAPNDSFAIVDEDDGRPLELGAVHVHRGWLCGEVRRVPAGPPRAFALVIDQTARGGGRHSFNSAFRSVDRIRLALTFDDGPAPAGDPDDGLATGSPTARVLDVLASWRHGADKSRQGLAAAFFVLTGPDRFMGSVYPKGETADGLALMSRAQREGHLLAVHWGGGYGSQGRHHTSRVDNGGDGGDLDGDGAAGEDRPYDLDGDGIPDGRNALESELRQCMARIREAGAAEVRFVRPPRYVWQVDGRPEIGRRVLDTYGRLGLKMILTDARLGDGGYPIVSRFSLMKHELAGTLRHAVRSGHADIVLAMHDSNPRTAAHLEAWLDRVERIMSGLQLGGQRLRPGLDFEFVSSRDELRAVLERKNRFAMPREAHGLAIGP